MTRANISVEALRSHGWVPCYIQETMTQYTLEEVVQKVQAGAKVEVVKSTLTRNEYGVVDGATMMFRFMSPEEVKAALEAEADERYWKAIKRIEERNRCRIRRGR